MFKYYLTLVETKDWANKHLWIGCTKETAKHLMSRGPTNENTFYDSGALAKSRFEEKNEDIDPIEQDDSDSISNLIVEGWLPWDPEDILDIKRLVVNKMPVKQRYILESFLDGLNYTNINVTEKYWRYHFAKGVEFIKKELKL